MNVEKIDFAIITILPEEYEAIHTRFTPQPYRVSSNQHIYGLSLVQTKAGQNCRVAIARTSRSGNDVSQQLANWLINDLDPQILLVVGIGGGVPDNDFTLGDVIVSSHIHNFDVNALKGDEVAYDVTGGIHPMISAITANLYLYQDLLAGWNTETSIGMLRPKLLLTEKSVKEFIDKSVDEAWREKVEKAFQWHFDGIQRGVRAPKFLPGTIASSNTLVRSDAILAHWLQGTRSIRAVEMEVAGVYQAAQQIHQQYPVMAIRGVSDIVGFKRDDNWKHYACQTAAAFAYAFITAGIVEPRGNTLSSVDGTDIKDQKKPVEIFCCYASKDRPLLMELKNHLKLWERQQLITLWADTDISPGANWRKEISRYLDSAHIILLLVSPDFLASEYCYSTEMTHAMERYERGEVCVIPVILRSCVWEEASFGELQALPTDAKPIKSSEWHTQDEALADVVRGLRRVIIGVASKSRTKQSHSLAHIEELRSRDGDADQETQPNTLHLSEEPPRSLNQTITPPDAGAKLSSENVLLPPKPVPPIAHSGPIKGIIHKLPRRIIGRSLAIAVVSVILLGSMVGYLLYAWLFQGKIMIPDSLVSTPPVLATQIPSQTIPPSVYPSYLPGRGISPYSDPLNHPSNSWEIASNCQFLNEMYHVRASEHEAYTICHQQANEFTDFAFEVQMKIVTGDCGGMVFRSEKSKYKFYRVDICSDGDMRVFLQGDSSLNPLFYKNITDIKQNPKKTHVVAIVAQGSILSLYIDQKSIGQIRDETYSNGQIGLTAYERSNLTDIAYMNVRIWALKS